MFFKSILLLFVCYTTIWWPKTTQHSNQMTWIYLCYHRLCRHKLSFYFYFSALHEYHTVILQLITNNFGSIQYVNCKFHSHKSGYCVLKINILVNKMCLWNTDVPGWQHQGHKVKIFGTAGKVLSDGKHMWNIKALSVTVTKLWLRLKFSKCRSKVTVKVKVKIWYWWKGLVTRNTHVKYESPISYGSKVMIKVKVFQNVGQRSRSRSQGQNFGTDGKVLSQGIHMWNMKALSLTVQKLWSRLKFSKLKVKGHGQGHKVKHLVLMERSCHKEYTCEIWKPYLLRFKSYDQG